MRCKQKQRIIQYKNANKTQLTKNALKKYEHNIVLFK